MHERLAFWFNNFCAAALIAVVFWTTVLLFRDGRAAAFAALVTALVPELLRWSNTAAVEPSAALFAAFAMMTSVHFVRARTAAALLWMTVAAAFAAQFRIESILILPLVGLTVVLFAPGELRRLRLWTAALAGMVLYAPLLAHIAAVNDNDWGANGARASMAYWLPISRSTAPSTTRTGVFLPFIPCSR